MGTWSGICTPARLTSPYSPTSSASSLVHRIHRGHLGPPWGSSAASATGKGERVVGWAVLVITHPGPPVCRGSARSAGGCNIKGRPERNSSRGDVWAAGSAPQEHAEQAGGRGRTLPTPPRPSPHLLQHLSCPSPSGAHCKTFGDKPS